MPQEYQLGDKALYIKAVKNSLEIYSRNGIVSPRAWRASLDMLRQFDPELKDAKVDLAEDLRRPLRQARVGVTALPG